VDDNEDAATTLSELLQDTGHDVRTAFNGMRALEMARAFRPEVAFVDLNMPGFDGFDVARWVRAQSWGGEVRLVALTGMGQEADLQRTRAAGFDLHLTKPAALDDVLRALVREKATAG